MTAVAISAPRFDQAAVVIRTLRAIRGNLFVFGALSILFAVVPNGVFRWAQLHHWEQSRGGIPLAELALNVAFWASNLIGLYLLQAALIHGVVADLNGNRARFSECLFIGTRKFFLVVGLAILTGVCITLGMLLLILPGILIALSWSVAVPAALTEKLGIGDAIARSQALTKGHLSSIFILWIYLCLLALGSFVSLWLISFLAVSLGIVSFVGDLAVVRAFTASGAHAILALFGSAGIASVYYELRSIKEGIGPETLAAVFD